MIQHFAPADGRQLGNLDGGKIRIGYANAGIIE